MPRKCKTCQENVWKRSEHTRINLDSIWRAWCRWNSSLQAVSKINAVTNCLHYESLKYMQGFVSTDLSKRQQKITNQGDKEERIARITKAKRARNAIERVHNAVDVLAVEETPKTQTTNTSLHSCQLFKSRILSCSHLKYIILSDSLWEEGRLRAFRVDRYTQSVWCNRLLCGL